MGYLIFINLKIWLPLVDFESADTLTKILPILVPNYSEILGTLISTYNLYSSEKSQKNSNFFFKMCRIFGHIFTNFDFQPTKICQNLWKKILLGESKIQVIWSKGFCVICISVIWPSIFDIDFNIELKSKLGYIRCKRYENIFNKKIKFSRKPYYGNM